MYEDEDPYVGVDFGDGYMSLEDQLTLSLAQQLEESAGIVGGVEWDPAFEKYQKDPIGFITTFLNVPENTLRWSLNRHYGEHRWDGTPDPFVVALDALADGKNVGIESGTGTGKTFLAACVALWFVKCFPNSLVITVAPKEAQLTLHLWKEMGRLWPRVENSLFQNSERTKLRIRMKKGEDSWMIHGFVCGVGADEESATKAQGFHTEHMLFILEETPGIHRAIMNAIENTCTDDHNLRWAQGNPDHPLDELHQFCEQENVVNIRVSAWDHPNIVSKLKIVPGAISQTRLDERASKYGADSPLFLSRVRGICPAEATDSIIKLRWCTAAALRYDDLTLRAGLRAMGVDVANSLAGDVAAIAHGKGACLLEVRSFQCPDSNVLGFNVGLEMDANNISPLQVGIDVVGVGAGTVNEGRRIGKVFRAINGGAAPFEKAMDDAPYGNLRAQMWWQMRMDLQDGNIALPDDEELFADLTAVRFVMKANKIWVEDKKELRKRLGRSPDKGDAAVMWNFVRQYGTFAWKPNAADHVSMWSHV